MPCRPEDMDSAARRVACRAIGCAPAHAVPVGCFVPQFVWVFASRECLPSPIARDLGVRREREPLIEPTPR